MALKLAIVLVNDGNGNVDRVLLEADVPRIVADELEKLSGRTMTGKKIGSLAARASRDAYALAEHRLREQTTALT
jgi:hypothetical protein